MRVQGDKAKASADFDAAVATVTRILDSTSGLVKAVCRPSLLRPLVTQAARLRLSKQALTTPIVPSTAGTAVPSAAGSQVQKALCFSAVCSHKAVEIKDKKAVIEQWLKLMPDVQLECGVKVRLRLKLFPRLFF